MPFSYMTFPVIFQCGFLSPVLPPTLLCKCQGLTLEPQDTASEQRREQQLAGKANPKTCPLPPAQVHAMFNISSFRMGFSWQRRFQKDKEGTE